MADYFAIFQLPRAFNIEEGILDQQYFSLQQHYHPDKLTHKDPVEKSRFLQLAMTVNQAYETLKIPLKRAEYLLLLEGMPVNTEKGGIKPDQLLLMEAMEQREALMEAATIEAVTLLEQEAKEQEQQIIGNFMEHYEKKCLEKAAQTVIKWRYIVKFIEEARLKKSIMKRNS